MAHLHRSPDRTVDKPSIFDDGETVTVSQQSTTSVRFMENDVFADVTLFCGSNSFRAHRVLLAHSSEYFEDVFLQTALPYGAPVVVIVANMRVDVLQLLVDYIYNGNVQVGVKDWAEFEAAAGVLKIRGLCGDAGERSDWTGGQHNMSPTSRNSLNEMCATDFLDTNLLSESNSGNGDDDFQVKKNNKTKAGFVAPTPTASASLKADKANGAKANANGKKIPVFGKKSVAAQKRPAETVTKSPEEKKPRKAPARRSEKEIPDKIIADILDTVSQEDKETSEVAGLIADVMSQYEKMRDKNEGPMKRGPKPKSKAGEEGVNKLRDEAENNIQKAILDVKDGKVPVTKAALTHGVSVSTLRTRLKKLGISPAATTRKSDTTVPAALEKLEARDSKEVVSPKKQELDDATATVVKDLKDPVAVSASDKDVKDPDTVVSAELKDVEDPVTVAAVPTDTDVEEPSADTTSSIDVESPKSEKSAYSDSQPEPSSLLKISVELEGAEVVDAEVSESVEKTPELASEEEATS